MSPGLDIAAFGKHPFSRLARIRAGAAPESKLKKLLSKSQGRIYDYQNLESKSKEREINDFFKKTNLLIPGNRHNPG